MKAMETLGKWYEARMGDDQGLVVSELTGENIAVTYKKEYAQLIACAPEMLEALRLMRDSLSEAIVLAKITNKETPTYALRWERERRTVNELMTQAMGGNNAR